MKKIVIIIMSIVISVMAYSKDIPVIKAEIGYKVDLSEKAVDNFEKIMTRKNGEKPLTEKEVKELERVESENYGLYDISKEQIWDVYGNGDSEMTCFPIPYKIETSSQLSNQNGINYSGENLFDNSFKTAWVEGREGYGIEEYIKFYINNIKLNKKNVTTQAS